MTAPQTPFLTTREVADLLRVKERKVYDLAASDEIPYRRITGKLLFPRDEIMAWIGGAAPLTRSMVVAGSHDPLLDWALRESGAGLASLFDGSGDGLRRFLDRDAALCGLHIPEEDGWNRTTIAAAAPPDAVLIGWARRAQGLILTPGQSEVASIADLRGRRVAMRQDGSGARALFERVLADVGLSVDDLDTGAGPARTEAEAAAAVASGEAEAAFGLAAMARQYGLGFVEVAVESFDLLVDRHAYFEPPVQALLDFTTTARFRDKAATLGGYDMTCLGVVRWNAP